MQARLDSYWHRLAESYWAVGSPLRPPQEVVAFVSSAVEEFVHRASREHIRVLLLGVTPAIAQMKWPRSTLLTAVDNSSDMVRAVWPGNAIGHRVGICADWLTLPLPNEGMDIVVGDGVMNCVRFPGGFQMLAKSIHRVLRPQGRLILRCYLRPPIRERPEDLLADVSRGAIGNFHELKFRLLMALQETAEEGVAVDTVYRTWESWRDRIQDACEQAGWDQQAIDTIEMYRDMKTVHTFPTLAEMRSVWLELFDEVQISIPTYSLSERCPILVLERRKI